MNPPHRARVRLAAVLALAFAGATAAAPAVRAAPVREDMAWIPAGRYVPLYRPPARTASGAAVGAPRPLRVPGFWLARHAVTNAEFLAFVREHPEWRRSRVRRLFADEAYLRHWRGDLEPGELARPDGPVVNVSWFAARAYCAAHGRRLPTVAEWEYVASANERSAAATRDPAFQDRLRAWYSRPSPARLDPVGSTFRNAYGIWDMHGLVWEWTSDFSSALVTGESRGDTGLDRSLFCGSGAANAADFRDYAAFMRFAFRASLAARYCVGDLGFREAESAAPAVAGREGR